MAKNYDFGGWATRNDLKCSDGRTIRKDAFKDNDGMTVPLVWNHDHKEANNVLGHALLENREEGVYAYCTFNNTENGQIAKDLVTHGDITSLSIYANKLKQIGGDVLHGAIREVSLVLAGANPGAFIDTVIAHADNTDEEAILFTGEEISLEHSCDNSNKETKKEESLEHAKEETKKEEEKMPEKEKTVKEIVNSMSEEQQNTMYALIGAAVEDAKTKKEETDEKESEEEGKEMKHNVFEEKEADNTENVLSHAEMTEIVADAKRCGSMKDAVLQHGIENIDYLFPDAKNLNNTPGFINTNPIAWVGEVMKGIHHTPFSRIKMQFADITEDGARAKGFLKGNYKKDEVFSLLKRTITPTTVYKKQKLDRDDIVDITDFDVVAWLKSEMRMKLDEELARAFLFGDGRLASDEDKINESNIIPVIKDTTDNLYAMDYVITPATGESQAHAIISGMVKAMDAYEGSGNVTLFLKQSLVSDMMLMEDTLGHRLYKNMADLADAMLVNRIVKVPASIVPAGKLGVALDLRDYTVGADKGGAVSMFDDFDIDYNAQKYLIETRCSGALSVPHSAIVLTAGSAE